MNNVSTNGIVISTMPIGEYDRRVEILTSEYGRITAFARGARKPGSPLVSVTRAFACGRFELYQGKTSYSVGSAAISEYFDELTTDIEITYYGFYFLELAQYFSRENVEASDMLNLLYFSLKALSLRKIPNKLVKAIFELKMLQINGLSPSLEKLRMASGAFTFAQGISSGALKAYEYVLFNNSGKLFSFLLSNEVLEEFERIVKILIEQNTDKKFKSLSLINDLL